MVSGHMRYYDCFTMCSSIMQSAIFLYCVRCAYFLINTTTQSKMALGHQQKCKSSVWSHSFIESMQVWMYMMITTRKNGKIQSIKIQSSFCYFQMIALLILPGNQSGFTTILFGIVMSMVYVMQESFNKTTKCQKEHLISFFWCSIQIYWKI